MRSSPREIGPKISFPKTLRQSVAFFPNSAHMRRMQRLSADNRADKARGEAETTQSGGRGRFSAKTDDPTVDAIYRAIPGRAALPHPQETALACGFTPEGCAAFTDPAPTASRLVPAVSVRFHPAESGVRDTGVTASYACPTVSANEGSTIASQKREIQALHPAWMRELPEAAATVELLSGHKAPRASLPLLRTTLCRILDRRGADGEPDLRANLRRIGALLEDLSRRRCRPRTG
jgi:hypothetical protein